MNNKPPTFVDLILHGSAIIDDVDDYIEIWHNTDTNQTLSEFLGLTEQEYARFVEDHSSLRKILEIR